MAEVQVLHNIAVYSNPGHNQRRFYGRLPLKVGTLYDNIVIAVPGITFKHQASVVPVANSVCGGKNPALQMYSFHNGEDGTLANLCQIAQSMCTILAYYALNPNAQIYRVWHSKTNLRDDGFFQVSSTIAAATHKATALPVLQHWQYDVIGAVSANAHKKCCSTMCTKSGSRTVLAALFVFGGTMCEECWNRNIKKQMCLGKKISSATAADYLNSLTPAARNIIYPALKRLRRDALVAALHCDYAKHLDYTDAAALSVHGSAIAMEWYYFLDIYQNKKVALNVLPPFAMARNIGRCMLANTGKSAFKRYKQFQQIGRLMYDQRDTITNTGMFTLKLNRNPSFKDAEFKPFVIVHSVHCLQWDLYPWNEFVWFQDIDLCVHADAIIVWNALLTGKLKLILQPCPPVPVDKLRPRVTEKKQQYDCRKTIQFTQTNSAVLPPQKIYNGHYLTYSKLRSLWETYTELCDKHAAVQNVPPLTLTIVGSYINAISGPTYTYCTAPEKRIRYGGIWQALVEHSIDVFRTSVKLADDVPHYNTMQYIGDDASVEITAAIRAENACKDEGWSNTSINDLLDTCNTFGIPAAETVDDTYINMFNSATVSAAKRATIMPQTFLASNQANTQIAQNVSHGFIHLPSQKPKTV